MQKGSICSLESFSCFHSLKVLIYFCAQHLFCANISRLFVFEMSESIVFI